MEAELDEYLDYEGSYNPDYKHKKLRSSYGEIPFEVPQDRNGNFSPIIVPKHKKTYTKSSRKSLLCQPKA